MNSLKAPWGKTDRNGSRRYLTLGFYNYDSSENEQHDCLNRVIHCYTSHGRHPALCFVHVELRFSDNIAFSITKENGIHYEQRTLSSHNYSTFFRFCVTAEQENQMKATALCLLEQNSRFNLVGFIWNFLPLTSCCTYKPTDKFICTDLILTVMQSGGLFQNVENVSRTSPNDLYDMCIRSESGAKLTFNSKSQ